MSSEKNSEKETLGLPSGGEAAVDGPLPPKDALVGQGTPLESLTDRQFTYLEGRLNGLSPFAAARAAGVKECNLKGEAYRLERHPKVREAAQFVINNGMGGTVDRSTVLEGLMDAVKSAATSAELTQAWREIGRLIGAYAPDRMEHVVVDMTHDELKTVSDKELLGLGKSQKLASEHLLEAMEAEFEVISTAIEEPKVVNPDAKKAE